MDTAQTFTTQFNGKPLKYSAISPGQAIAFKSMMDAGGSAINADTMDVLIDLLTGCVGPDQWKTIRRALLLNEVEPADLFALLEKVLNRSKKQISEEAAVATVTAVADKTL